MILIEDNTSAVLPIILDRGFDFFDQQIPGEKEIDQVHLLQPSQRFDFDLQV